MKKFFFFAAALVAALTVNAQGVEKTWNFTSIFTKATTFEALDTVAPMPELVADELYTYGNTDKGFAVDVAQSPKYYGDFFTVADQDENKKVARLKTQGSGSVKVKESGKVDVKGALAFSVAGNSEVKVAAISSNGSAVRRLALITAEGATVATADVAGNIGGKDAGTQPFVFNYSGPATTLYLVSMQNPDEDPAFVAGGLNFYKVAATNVVPFVVPTAIENHAAEVKATKMVENGKVVILKGGKKYDVMGAEL